MTKKEIIWREILYQVLEKKKFKFTQKELAEKFNFSLSTVFNALKIPRTSHAVRVTGRFFEVIDKHKFLSIWATHRNLDKDIIYQTRVNLPIKKIESELPADVIPTAYTAYRFKTKDAPADYDKVYVYTKNLDQIRKRFPASQESANLIVLKQDEYLASYGQVAPLAQIFVDLWNLREWYANDFLQAMKDDIV